MKLSNTESAVLRVLFQGLLELGIMQKVDYQRCTECETRGTLENGSICAHCHGLGYVRSEDDDDEDEDDLPSPCFVPAK